MFKLPIKQTKRHILHIDADAFFASVEQALNPKLKGLPVLVGGPSDKYGIVSACSYEAKRMGISTAMPMYLAKRKCPHAVVVPGHFNAYRDFSRKMYKIFTKYTPDVEMGSIDEAFLDITGFDKTYKKTPAQIARTIMFHIHKKLGISVSCGLSSNKTVSKVASSQHKPHKLTVVPFGKERSFLADLPLNAIPGIGKKTFENFQRFGFEKIIDIARLSSEGVIKEFGIQGIPIWKKCRGIDNRKIIANSTLPKSISKERTFYPHINDIQTCLQTLKELSDIVFSKLRAQKMKAKTIFIRIRYKGEGYGKASFQDYSFQKHIGLLSSANSELFPIAKALFKANFNKTYPIRLIGIGVSNLIQNYNLNLFNDSKKHDDLSTAIDKINNLRPSSTYPYKTNQTEHPLSSHK